MYAMAGNSDTALTIPPAFQVDTPFGTNVAGVSPAFFAVVAEAEFDSWLTIGVTDGSVNNGVSAIGLDFDAWTIDTPLGVDALGGSVFLMDPTTGPSGDVVLAQLTMPSSSSASISALLQGKGGGADWQSPATWSIEGDGSPPPPPPAPVLCAADEYVMSNVCTPCAAGSTNDAGDDASGADTFCVFPPPPPPDYGTGEFTTALNTVSTSGVAGMTTYQL